jgi:guanylate kinase
MPYQNRIRITMQRGKRIRGGDHWKFGFCIPDFPFSLTPMPQRTGILLVVSGPSGSGKTTLCRRLADEGEASYSTSCTTRAARPGEVNGRDYHFLSREEFTTKRGAGEFLESAEVHGNLYGTLKSEVTGRLGQGNDVVMDLDVQGAALVRACTDTAIRAAAVDLFVMPPGEDELLSRLSGRGTDSPEVIALRMKNALEEMGHWPEYTYRLLSGSQEEDYARFKALVIAERMRVSRLAVG